MTMTSSLSNSAVATIESLRFDPEAEMRFCLIPLGSIYWSDELPSKMFLEFSEGADRNFAMRLFAIRINFWNSGELNSKERFFWNEAQARFSRWPIFQRMELTDESRRAHEEVQKEAEEFFVHLSEEADELELSKDGDYTSFSTTFNLREGDEP
jgi:hypothetical protein